MPIRFGVHSGQQDLSLDDLRRHWRWFDEAGMDWISVWDHFYEAPPIDGSHPHFEAIACLAALATETERVRIGCLVFCVPYRNPALLAKALTTLDHLSHGRIEAGLGAGWHSLEFEAYGYPFDRIGTRMDMLEEGVAIVRGLLTQERTTFQGRHYRVENAACQPPPVQPRLPIWIGGLGEQRTLPLAARHADGWNAAYPTPETFARLNARLTDLCHDAGRDPLAVRRSVNLVFNLGSTPARAATEEERIGAVWGAGAERIRGGSLCGTPDAAAERIAAYVEAGAQDINVALRAPWDAEALRVYIEEVVPALRKQFA